MTSKFALAALLLGGIASAGPALAQAGSGATTPDAGTAATGAAPVRNPVLGDPAARPAPRRQARRPLPASADRPAPSSQNGNQPDRAAAGGGAR
jgi:hypothetical protein